MLENKRLKFRMTHSKLPLFLIQNKIQFLSRMLKKLYLTFIFTVRHKCNKFTDACHNTSQQIT
jgi:hypothetical protein